MVRITYITFSLFAVFYEHPRTAIVAPNATVVFSCAGSAYTDMWLDNSTVPTTISIVKAKYNFLSQTRTSNELNVTVSFIAKTELNATRVQCAISGYPEVQSEIAYLYIAGITSLSIFYTIINKKVKYMTMYICIHKRENGSEY